MSINFHRSGIAKIGLAALLMVMVAFSWLDPIDTQATEQVDTGLKRALITFAASRTLKETLNKPPNGSAVCSE